MANGGHLASLHSIQDATDVYAAANQRDSWIGLQRASINHQWAWSDGTAYGVDVIGSPDLTELWHSQATRHNYGTAADDLCGRWGWRGSGKWDDVPCGNSYPFTTVATFGVISSPLHRK